MNKYEVLGIIGEGAYGVVLRCRNRENNELVAIKKFKENEDDDAVKKIVLREMKILRLLRHPNIVSLQEAFKRKGKLYLVFEYVQKNLLEVLENSPNGLSLSDVKRYMFQLCHSIDWCHRNCIIHRDIKPENLLISLRTKELKLCDFGFARPIASPNIDLTDYVATRWYRSPELLLGSVNYTTSIDMWAIGCIMGELIDGQPLFPGESEIDQLYIIQRTLGPLSIEHQQLFSNNPRFIGVNFPNMKYPETLEKRYVGNVSKRGMAFMKHCLVMCPHNRITSKQAVQHLYFEDLIGEYASKYPFVKHESFIDKNASTQAMPKSETLQSTRIYSSCRELDKSQHFSPPILCNVLPNCIEKIETGICGIYKTQDGQNKLKPVQNTPISRSKTIFPQCINSSSRDSLTTNQINPCHLNKVQKPPLHNFDPNLNVKYKNKTEIVNETENFGKGHRGGEDVMGWKISADQNQMGLKQGSRAGLEQQRESEMRAFHNFSQQLPSELFQKIERSNDIKLVKNCNDSRNRVGDDRIGPSKDQESKCYRNASISKNSINMYDGSSRIMPKKKKDLSSILPNLNLHSNYENIKSNSPISLFQQ